VAGAGSARLPRGGRDGHPPRGDDHGRGGQGVSARGGIQEPLRPGDEGAGLRAVRDLSEHREPRPPDSAGALGRPGGARRPREAQQHAPAALAGTARGQRRARGLRVPPDALSPRREAPVLRDDEGCRTARREVLSGMAALAASTLVSRRHAEAQMAIVKPHRIDVHHHHTPPPYLAAIAAKSVTGPVRDWTPEKSIADMDRAGVATALTSITTPALRFLDDAGARKLARECNDYSAKLVADGKGRFGMFAVMPMPYVEATLQEIGYALDSLKADGIALLTSYGDKWLGDPAFTPVLEELNRRRAVVYTHPTTANCCGNL